MARHTVGLVPVGGAVRDYPLVQSRCDYKVLDVYTIAEVVQDYYCNATVNRDVDFVFPLPPSSAVCSFRSILDDDKVIKGVIKVKGEAKEEHSEAKEEYSEAVAHGKTAALLQQDHPDGDFPRRPLPINLTSQKVFRCFLGNIKPKQKISVHISLVAVVPHDGNSPQSFRITVPTAIAARYGRAPTNVPWFNTNHGRRFRLTVAVQMSDAVISVSSPSHPISLTLGCAQEKRKGNYEPSKAFIHLEDSIFLDKDIVIVVSAEGLDAPRCSVERWLASEGAEETTDAYALTLVPKFNLPALPSQEYIFLVDRSGSMRGGRMEEVKTSLQIMLRSLPSRNTACNIVSFGSRYTSLWSKSQAYNAETVAQASKHVDAFTANYGGTELRSALQFAFSSRIAIHSGLSVENLAASVFVLTDGEAWDLDGIIDLVTENVEAASKQGNLLRTFVMGIGNQVSTAMCEGIARAGKGSAIFVAEGEKPDAKLMGLLKAARGGVVENLNVDWGIAEPTDGLEDHFEVNREPPKAKFEASESRLGALTLFDEGEPSSDGAEIGPKRTSVQLLPLPVLQQAPRFDRLPVPLYPGFRCSIFAIVKQSQNPGPHSPFVKITGTVLGREIAFRIPVDPIDIGADVTAKAMESGKLLHTLAAKALIQLYEDMPFTLETKAQIERLGKRYSLASSVTSFLAIDQESSSEMHSSPVEKTGGHTSHKALPNRSAMWQATLAGGMSTQSTAPFTYRMPILPSSMAPALSASPRRPALTTPRSSPTPQSDVSGAGGYLPTLFGFVRARSLDLGATSSAVTSSVSGLGSRDPANSLGTVYSFREENPRANSVYPASRERHLNLRRKILRHSRFPPNHLFLILQKRNGGTTVLRLTTCQVIALTRRPPTLPRLQSRRGHWNQSHVYSNLTEVSLAILRSWNRYARASQFLRYRRC